MSKNNTFNIRAFTKDCVLPTALSLSAIALFIALFSYLIDHPEIINSISQSISNFFTVSISGFYWVVGASYLSLFLILISLCAVMKYDNVPSSLTNVLVAGILMAVISNILLIHSFNIDQLINYQSTLFLTALWPFWLITLSILAVVIYKMNG